MAGFNNTPPASEFRRPTSWGRTRSPKNVLSSHRAGTSSTGATLNVPTAAPTATDSSLGYVTENQRFLHLLLDTDASGDNRTVTVYGFSYALGRWSPLTDTRGNAVTIAANDASTYKVFEIYGTDKVYFQINSDFTEADDFFYAAGSTF
jgi:hypothetical protein|tara:strand:- start:1074 stop:1520 length:447 start_codon:yes stop_codon:yes gene_type:complete